MADNVEFDEWCDPANPRKIKAEDIVAAARRIVGAVVKTPCSKAHMGERLGLEMYLKQEFLQYTGSFKERGARNALMNLTDDQKKNGVIAASTGNHGLALSWHSTNLNIPCIIVMPKNAAIVKRAKCETYGAKVLLHGINIGEAKRFAMGISKDKHMMYINGYDHPNIVEGQGTIGLEIVEQIPEIEAILVPVGGGSLCAGIATAAKYLKPDVEIYGVCTDKCTTMVESLKNNERTAVPIDSTIADGLGVPLIGVNTFHSLKGLLDKMVVVKEDWVARAIMHIVEEERYVVEGAGAVAVAAIMAGLFPNLKGKKVCCILSGGNIDTSILARALERGMAAEGRLIKMKVTVSDRPGGLAELCQMMTAIGVTVRDCVPERAWVKGDVFSAQMKLVVETRGWDHTKELIEATKKNYKEYYFHEINQSEKPAGSRRGPCLAPHPVCMQK
ncbi:L-threonine ammonia-lyase-like [Cydia splendana]|uniref:L-threonine ammonia-lyase-like n=1 Tax=Cydia splendana TaxID=1100963 RepID=UPI00212822A1